MSRKLRDIIPTATSLLVPKLACSRVVQQNIAERRNKSKVQYNKKALTPLREFTEGEKVYLKPHPTNRSQPWTHGEVEEKPTPRSFVVKTAMGLVRRNHCQIRRAKAEPGDGCSTMMDQLDQLCQVETVLIGLVFFALFLLVFCLHIFLKREGVTQLCITCFVAPTCITILHVTETLTLLSSFNSQLHILTSLRL